MTVDLPVLTVLCPSADESSPALSTSDSSGRVPAGLDELRGQFSIRLTDVEHLREDISGATVLLLWDFFSGAVEDVWDQAQDLEWIHIAAAGVDKLLFPALQDSAVTLTNAQGTFDVPIAEWVLAAVLAQAKDFRGSWVYQRDREWVHRETHSVTGSTALVVGAGAIGREIAKMLTAVGVQVRGVGSRSRDDDADFGTVYASTELVDVVGWADHVINAAPLTPATTGMFTAEVFEAMKSSAHFVNIGRGESVDETALSAALDQGKIAYASLDVFAQEPLPQESPLWNAPNALISAHMSGDVIGWRETLAQQFIANAQRWIADEPLRGVVDKKLGYVPRP